MSKPDELFTTELAAYVSAGYPLLSVSTPEEVRALEAIREAGWRAVRRGVTVKEALAAVGEVDPDILPDAFGAFLPTDPEYRPDATLDDFVATAHGLRTREGCDMAAEVALDAVSSRLIVYDTVQGFVAAGVGDDGGNGLFVDDPYGAIRLLEDEKPLPSHCLVVFRDLHEYLADPQNPRLRRALRRLVENDSLVGDGRRRTVVLLQPDWTPPVGLRHLVTPVDFRPPDRAALTGVLDRVRTSPGLADKVQPTAAVAHDLVTAMQGMTEAEAVNAAYLIGVRRQGFPAAAVTDVHEMKAKSFADDAVLTYASAAAIAAAPAMGGYDNYMDFVDEAKACRSDGARAFGLKPPKGVLLLGPAGTGKSTVAVVTARRMGLPLVSYDFGSTFGSLVGESEARQKAALARITALGDCVLLIDEADKAFGGVVGSQGDGGVGQRVFGRLLTWLAVENTRAFVIMTMNRLVDPDTGRQIVPIETIRAGRLDAVFYTALPTPPERARIFDVHMTRNGASWELLSERERADLVEATDRYTGAEIEQVVIKAVRSAYVRRGELTPKAGELHEAKRTVSPVAVLDAINIQKIEEFCRDRATPVGRPPVVQATAGRRKRAVE